MNFQPPEQDDPRDDDDREQAAQAETAQAAPVVPEALHTFLNAAAGEGLVIGGVDAADLYIAIFPERYAQACATPGATHGN